MLLAEHPLAALNRAPTERQGLRRVAQRPQASGQIVNADERLRMLLAEHPLAALNRAPTERQGLRRVAQRPQASGQIVHANERVGVLRAKHPVDKDLTPIIAWLAKLRVKVATDGTDIDRRRCRPAPLISVSNLAECLLALGDAAGALPLHRRALDSRERVLGPEHPDALISVNNLALCLEELGDAAGALPLFRRALESHERKRAVFTP
jgi:hypothetical protein